MAFLYDANGKELFEGGATKDAVRDAIQAAALADEFGTAEEIADRHGLRGICLKCAIKNATTAHYDRDSIIRRVCITCFHELNPQSDTLDTVVYLQGLFRRDVQ